MEGAAIAGIKKFYVHDDYSTQPVLEALLENVALGVIHYQYWASQDTSGHGRQMQTYEQCLDLHGHKHKVCSAQMTSSSLPSLHASRSNSSAMKNTQLRASLLLSTCHMCCLIVAVDGFL